MVKLKSTAQKKVAAAEHSEQQAIELVLHAKHHDPFSFLGLHTNGDTTIYRTFLPHAKSVWLKIDHTWQPLTKKDAAGLFVWQSEDQNVKANTLSPSTPALLKIEYDVTSFESYDPYTFGTTLTQDELYLFGEGRLKQAYKTFGAHFMEMHGISGVRFAVWAPNAERVSVVGNFNRWDGRVHAMRSHGF